MKQKMTHAEMVDGICYGIELGRILAVVCDGELRLFTDKHVGIHLTQEEVNSAISASEYRRLSEADYHAREN